MDQDHYVSIMITIFVIIVVIVIILENHWNYKIYIFMLPIKHLDSRRVCNVPLKESALEGAEGEALPESDHYQVNVAGEKKMKDNCCAHFMKFKVFTMLLL